MSYGMFVVVFFFFFKQKTAYEMRISDWSSDVCSSDLGDQCHADAAVEGARHLAGLDIALRLEEGHQPRLRPGIGVDEGMQPLRQHARDVFEEPAASDVGERVAAPAADNGQTRLPIYTRRPPPRVHQSTPHPPIPCALYL